MSLLQNKNSTRSVLVVAAHPDDEVLGCGAAMARHAKAGDQVHVLLMAEGITSRDKRPARNKRASELSRLRISAQKANALLGAKSVSFGEFPDNRMDSVDLLEIVKVIESHIVRYQPSILYTHHSGDVNIDHRRVHDAVLAASRPQPQQSVKSLLSFEVPSSTEWQTDSRFSFTPNTFIDATQTLKSKLEALRVYGSEMRPFPHARSLKAIEHLAHWRGATVGLEAAEAFIVGRQVITP